MKQRIIRLSIFLTLCLVLLISFCGCSNNKSKIYKYDSNGVSFEISSSLTKDYKLYFPLSKDNNSSEEIKEFEKIEELDKGKGRTPVFDIAVYKDGHRIFDIGFVHKAKIEESRQYAQTRAENPSEDLEVKLLDKVTINNIEYFYCYYDQKGYGVNYYRLGAEFAESKDSAVMITSYTDKEETEKIIKNLSVKFLKDE